jgi:cob(I)alamin adenosyltransferase
MKIYTRRGDGGETDLVGSGRVAKDHARVEAYGTVDELNATLGLAAAANRQDDVRSLLEDLQRQLFALGALLATPEARHRTASGMRAPGDEEISALEARIDAFEKELAPLEHFVLPGGTPAAAAFHLARTVCRRAERSAVALARSEGIDPGALRFLNRLSDLLFVLARVENRRAGVADVEWTGFGRR